MIPPLDKETVDKLTKPRWRVWVEREDGMTHVSDRREGLRQHAISAALLEYLDAQPDAALGKFTVWAKELA